MKLHRGYRCYNATKDITLIYLGVEKIKANFLWFKREHSGLLITLALHN